MAQRTPCSRHARSVWIASCTDCTAWHLAGALADRDQTAPVPAGSPPGSRDSTRGSGEAEAA